MRIELTRDMWLQVLKACGVNPATAARWAPLWEKHIQPEAFSIGNRELDDFTGQVLHETGRLEKLTEGLNYSPQRLMEVWPARFPSLEKATKYAWSPQNLANFTYGGRYGNKAPGDGYKYRGRGIPMITFYDNYLLLEKLTGLPLTTNPDLLLDPDIALRCAVLWWEDEVPDSAIDNIEKVTREVQGGSQELAVRDRYTRTARAELMRFLK